MTPTEFKNIRATLGLSQSELATALGLSDAGTVSKYERGIINMSGPIKMLMHIYRIMGSRFVRDVVLEDVVLNLKNGGLTYAKTSTDNSNAYNSGMHDG